MWQKLVQKRSWAILVATLALAACMKSPEERTLHDTAHTVILPLYQQFSVQTRTLDDTARAFCGANEKTTELYDSLHHAWREAMKSWATVQMIQTGPIAENNRAWSIEFWPDLNNLIARKIDKLLEGDAPLTAEAIGEASVVVQGLSAMEYLLFDDEAGALERYAGNSEDSERWCQALVAMAGHTRQVAADLFDGWRPGGGDFVTTFSAPGPDNQQFPDEKAALAALVGNLVFGVEQIKNDKLQRPLGLGNGKPNPYLLEWWRSQGARDAIAANLTSIQQQFTADNGFGLDDYLYEVPDGVALSRDIQELIAIAHKHVAGIRQPLTDAVEDEEQREALIKASEALAKLLRLLKEDLPAALGISLSFNANDGD